MRRPATRSVYSPVVHSLAKGLHLGAVYSLQAHENVYITCKNKKNNFQVKLSILIYDVNIIIPITTVIKYKFSTFVWEKEPAAVWIWLWCVSQTLYTRNLVYQVVEPSRKMVISYFLHGCEQIKFLTETTQWKKHWFGLTVQEGTLHNGDTGMIMVLGVQSQNSSHLAHISTDQELRAWNALFIWLSPVPIFIQFETPDHGTVPPPQAGLPTSVKTLWESPLETHPEVYLLGSSKFRQVDSEDYSPQRLTSQKVLV